MSKNIANKAKEEGMKANHIYTCENNNEAIDLLKGIMKKDDAILIKASNGMKFQEIFEKIC